MARQQDWWKENKRAVFGLSLFGVLFIINLIVRFTRAPVTYEGSGGGGDVVVSAPATPGGAPVVPAIASAPPIGEKEMKEMDVMVRDVSSMPPILRLPAISPDGQERPPLRDPFRWGAIGEIATLPPVIAPIDLTASGPIIAPPVLVSSCRSGKRLFAFVKYQKTMYFLGQGERLGNAPFRLVEAAGPTNGTVEGVVLEWADRARTVAERQPGEELKHRSIIHRLQGGGGPLQWPVPEESKTATPSPQVQMGTEAAAGSGAEIGIASGSASKALVATGSGAVGSESAPIETSGTLGMASLPPLLPSEPLSVSKLISHSSKISSAGAQIDGGKR